MIQFFPLYDHNAIKNAFPHITEGLEKVGKFSLGDISLDAVFNDMLAGALLLWVAYQDKKYIGFLTTRINQVPFGQRYMLIEHIYAKEKIPDELYMSGMEKIEKYAKQMQCSTIRFYTVRDKAFEKILGKFGFNPGYTVFKKEVQ